MKLGVYIATGLIRFYQWILSPIVHFLGGPQAGCRYQPTCSEYTLESIRKHGVVRGCYLGAQRIWRCNPYSKAGQDPVPKEFNLKRKL